MRREVFRVFCLTPSEKEIFSCPSTRSNDTKFVMLGIISSLVNFDRFISTCSSLSMLTTSLIESANISRRQSDKSPEVHTSVENKSSKSDIDISTTTVLDKPATTVLVNSCSDLELSALWRVIPES